MKKTIIALILVSVLAFTLAACKASPEAEKPEAPQQSESTTETPTASDEASDIPETDNTEEAAVDSDLEQLRADFDKNVGRTNYRETMAGDKTGNWRVAVVSILEGDLLDHVVEYHAAYMAPGEVHFLIPFTGEYTLLINDFGGDTLYVTRLEHIEGMDFNAEHVNDGDPIAEYVVTISTGEIREVTE